MIFIDTNIVIYSLDSSSEKQLPALGCFENGSYLSVQVLNEARSIFLSKLCLPNDKVKEMLDWVVSKATIIDLSLDDYELSWTLLKQNKISHWDSLIVANALRHDGTILYSEDMGHGQLINEQLKIVNPFL
jgi:predicted nucleic acid-binding protein